MDTISSYLSNTVCDAIPSDNEEECDVVFEPETSSSCSSVNKVIEANVDKQPIKMPVAQDNLTKPKKRGRKPKSKNETNDDEFIPSKLPKRSKTSDTPSTNDVIYIEDDKSILTFSATHDPNNNDVTFREQPVMHSFAGGFRLDCKFVYFPEQKSVDMLEIEIVQDKLIFFLFGDGKARIASVKLQQNIIDTKLIIRGVYDKMDNSVVVNFIEN